MRSAGDRYEAAAAAYLIGKGYRILERNFRLRLGEIDLIAEDGGTLVFIEVKGRFGADPREAVVDYKVGKVHRVAEAYLARTGQFEREIRFDALFVTETAAGCAFDHEIAAF